MKFLPGDKIFYILTKREYIVVDCYYIKHDGEKLELIDVKPVIKQNSDKFKRFKGYSSKYFELVLKINNHEIL